MRIVTSLTHISLLIVPLFLLSGCMKIDGTQAIQGNGMAQYDLTYDFSGFKNVYEALDELATTAGTQAPMEVDENFNFDCNYIGTINQPFQNVTCTDVRPNVMRITGNGKLKRSAFTSRKREGGKTLYQYVLRNSATPKSAAGVSSSAPSLGTPNLISGVITISMPGTITKSTVGTVEGNTVTVKLENLSRPRNVIQSIE